MEREVTSLPGLRIEEDSVDDICFSSDDGGGKRRVVSVILGELESQCKLFSGA